MSESEEKWMEMKLKMGEREAKSKANKTYKDEDESVNQP